MKTQQVYCLCLDSRAGTTSPEYKNFAKNVPLMLRIERKYCLISTHIWQGYLAFSYYFISDRIVCVLVTLYQWGHFVMLIRRNLNLVSCQLWPDKVFHVLQIKPRQQASALVHISHPHTQSQMRLLLSSDLYKWTSAKMRKHLLI